MNKSFELFLAANGNSCVKKTEQISAVIFNSSAENFGTLTSVLNQQIGRYLCFSDQAQSHEISRIIHRIPMGMVYLDSQQCIIKIKQKSNKYGSLKHGR